MNECPVCYTECTGNTYTEDAWGIVEEHWSCPYDCYHYEFVYGSFNVCVSIRGHHIEFYWGHDDKRKRDLWDAIDIVVLAARKTLLQDLLEKVNYGENG